MAVFTVIDHTELTSGTAEWSETGISGSYDHLLIKASVRSEAVAENDAFTMRLNGSTTSGDYSVTTLSATTTSPVSITESLTSELQCGLTPAANALADTFGAVTIWIPHYSNADNFKQVLITQCFPNDSTTDGEWQVSTRAALFVDSTATPTTRAITSVTIRRNSSDFAQYSTFTLYGITGA